MSTTYTGVNGNDPDAITLPSDGQGQLKADDVRVPFEAIMDKLATLKAFAHAITFAESIVTVSTAGAIVAPTGAYAAIVRGWGGGGGGAGGDRAKGSDRNAVGGGGGAGAVEDTVLIPIIGGDTYMSVHGAGGAAGTAGASPGTAPGVGGVGDPSTLTHVNTSTVVASFKGAGGGGISPNTNASAAVLPNEVSPGGEPIPALPQSIGVASVDHTALQSSAPQAGGRGVGGASPSSILNRGNASSRYAPGNGGATPPGATGTYFCGGGGGGGGAGPGGNGGDGGSGGVASNPGNATSGSAGTAPAAGSGAGGGGGGAAGCTPNAGSPGAGDGGAGSVGGSGKIEITFLVHT